MNMGRPEITKGSAARAARISSGPRDVTVLWTSAIRNAPSPVTDFDFDWRAMGAEIERHPHFPNRTNVSFIRRVDEHTIDVRFSSAARAKR